MEGEYDLFSIKEKYRKNIKRKIEDYCRSNYHKIPKSSMKLGVGLFNNRCQWNSIQQVAEGSFADVYLCIVVSDDEFPIVHFINKLNGKYVDNTLGYRFEEYDYYIIKRVDKEEYSRIVDVLYETKRMLLNTYSNRFINKLLYIDEHNLGI